jgi:hypothetical protein
MSDLFRRRIVVQVNTLKLTDLHMSFEIVKSLKPKTPNTAELHVINLNPDHRKQLQELEKVYVSVEAGYETGTSLIFRGDLRDVVSTREGADWITTITSDSGRRARKKRIMKSFAPGASVGEVLQSAAKAMGLRLGNTATKTVTAKIKGTQADKFFNGYALAGAVSDELDRLARSSGLEWSIQDDELQFLDDGTPLAELGIVLTPETGLIGSPERGNKGVMTARCLIIPDVYPGRRVQIVSEHVKGVYRVETTKHRGSTFDKDWYIDLELGTGTPVTGKKKAAAA